MHTNQLASLNSYLSNSLDTVQLTPPQQPYKLNYFNHDIATSTSITLGYNFLNKSKAHRLKASAILGAAYIYQKGAVSEPIQTNSWHFQTGAELSYQYFLPSTNYRLGFGASYELSYSNYNAQPTIGLLNFNISWKLFKF